MLTKETLNAILIKHLELMKNNSWWSSIKGFFTKSKLNKVEEITRFINELPIGSLGVEKCIALHNIVNQTEVDEQTNVLFTEIKTVLNESTSIQAQLLEFLKSGNYYSSRSHDFLAAMQELMPGYITPQVQQFSDHGLACLFLASSLYKMDHEPIAYFIISRVGESSLSFLAQQYNQLSNSQKSLVSWGIDWTIQLGLTFAGSTALQFALHYTLAATFQTLASQLFQSLKSTSYVEPYAEQYPLTFKCLNNVVNDTGFMLGTQSSIFLNNQIARIPSYFENKSQNQDSSENQREQFYSNKHQREKFKMGDRKEQTQKASEQQHNQKKRDLCPIKLNSKEKETLFGNCHGDPCTDVVNKVLGMSKQDALSCSEIKKRYYKLSLFCHPDKNGSSKESSEQMLYLNAARDRKVSMMKC